MNIIQIQDRLKGLPTNALVNYVEQPMGEVPIYLALGELQRRKEMKERFQADQMPPPSVAEQIVAENKPQPMAMGLGAMAPQQMMPGGQGVSMPPAAPQIDPRQLAASGIAANPQSAVGGTAMMKEGGIVGEVTNKFGKSNPVYEDGSIGAAYGLPISALLTALGIGTGTGGITTGIGGTILRQGIKPAYNYAKSNISKILGRGPYPKKPIISPSGTTFMPKGGINSASYFRRPSGFLLDSGLGTLGYKVYDYLTNSEERLANEKQQEENERAEIERQRFEIGEQLARDKENKGDGEAERDYFQEAIDKLSGYMKDDTGRARIDERMRKLDEKIDKRREDAGSMSLIEAGLNIAAGQSPDFLTNVSKGASAGVKGYTDRLKDVDKLEKESLALDMAVDNARRQEKLTIAKFGATSEAAKLSQLQTMAILKNKQDFQVGLRNMPDFGDIQKIYEEFQYSQQGKAFNELMENKGIKKGTDNYNRLREMEIQKLINSLMRGKGGGGGNSLFSIIE